MTFVLLAPFQLNCKACWQPCKQQPGLIRTRAVKPAIARQNKHTISHVSVNTNRPLATGFVIANYSQMTKREPLLLQQDILRGHLLLTKRAIHMKALVWCSVLEPKLVLNPTFTESEMARNQLGRAQWSTRIALFRWIQESASSEVKTWHMKNIQVPSKSHFWIRF